VDPATDSPEAGERPSRRPRLPTLSVDARLSAKISTTMLVAVGAVITWHANNLNSRFLSGEYRPRPPEPPAVVTAVEWLVSGALTHWSVPLFFALSGFLFARDLAPTVASFGRKWVTRARTLLLPFLLWSAIGVALFALEGSLTLPWGLDDPAVARRLARLDVIEAWLRYPVTYPLWFLQALLLCVLVSPVLYVLVARLGYVGLAPLVALWVLTRRGHGHYYDALALTFFALGMLVALRQRAGRWVPFSGERPLNSALAFSLLPLYVAACVAYGLTLRGSRDWWALVLIQLITCFGVAVVWLGYDAYLRRWETSRIVTFLAPLAFFVFVAQEPALGWFKRTLLVLTGGTGTGAWAALLAYALTPVVTIATVALLGAALRAALPRVYGVLTGGRGLTRRAPATSASRSAPPATGTDL
jgi:peptidoglycan/LPS O-acetylase OafA/YrhL